MIIVFGSINIDLVVQVMRIAAPGETVLGPSYETIAGGKGANQALAARRAGAQVAMAGAVGRDGFSGPALAQLKADGVDLSAVASVDAPTGAAFIAVDSLGQNAITVAAGANALAKAAQLEALPIGKGDWLLLQREVPDEEGQAAAEYARRHGARVLLNLAPGGSITKEYLALVDMLVMNEHEAILLGQSIGLRAPGHEDVARAVAHRTGAGIIITLGAEGALGWHKVKRHALKALPVAVVDTTAAGDAFVGAFAAALDAGRAFGAAMQAGLVAGSLACTQRGAQPSLPHAREIAAFLPV